MGRHRERIKKPKKRRGLVFRIFKYTTLTMAVLFFMGVIFVISYLLGLKEWKEFDPLKIKEMQQTLLIYDCDGQETAGLYNKQNRVYIQLEEIPLYVRNAFIAVEDARFYEHNGVDIIRTIGAILQSIRNGEAISATSSISQQLVRNTNLTNVRTMSRKLQEAVMAIKLEQVYKKDEILEMYLNYIPFGHGAYGIEAASRVYFGKTTSQLTIAEGAMLAGVIKAPSHYAPHINMDKSVQRRNLVLSLMEEQGYISAEQLQSAKSEQVVLCEEPKFEYGFFTDMVLSEAQNILNVDSEGLLSSGYRIYTTLDQGLQNKLEALFKNASNFPGNAEDGSICQSSFCILDSKTSEIRAVMGGRNYETRRGLNRALNMKRQPGSAIKPVLVYAPAMEKLGYMPTTLVLDEKGEFNGYVPKDSSSTYKGWVTLREAVSESLNLPAVRTLKDVGIEAAKLYASSVGIPFEKDDTGLTLALGGFTTGVSPLTLCNAFTPFANGGYFTYPSCITRIEDSTGEAVYIRPETKTSVLSKETAFLITSVLESTATEGTARRLGIEGMHIAAKTGTAGNDRGNRDAWTIAYNPDYTMCCWMGFDNNTTTHYLPSDVMGGTFPALLIRQLFDGLYSGNNAPDFAQPNSIVQAKIDIKSLENEQEPMLASAFTPKDETTLEYFLKDKAPGKYSTYWAVPSPPDDFNVANGESGLPVISFTPLQEFVIYRVMRIGKEESVPAVIGEYTGDMREVKFTDDSAEYGHTYMYYVLPVHPDIKTGGESLTGPSSPVVEISIMPEDEYMP
jgi:1A family penicillin-binding protein